MITAAKIAIPARDLQPTLKEFAVEMIPPFPMHTLQECYRAIFVADGMRFEVTRFTFETEWTIDALYQGEIPYFDNGIAHRWGTIQELAHPELVDWLNTIVADLT